MHAHHPVPAPETVPADRRMALLWLGLLLSALLLTGCDLPFIREPADPFVIYRPAMKAKFHEDLDRANPIAMQMPRYDITFSLDMVENVLRGSQQIVITNPGPDPWSELVFRLYPMLGQYGGGFNIGSLSANGQPIPYSFTPLGTGLRLDLSTPLLSGQQMTVQMGWSLKIPAWPDSTGVYALFGRSQDMISLPLFYPALAVYVPGPVIGTGHWWEDEGIVRGDAAFNASSLFVVTGTLPSDQIPVTSGALITSTVMEDGNTQRVWVSGPVREFLVHTSSQFRQASADVAGTRVTSYWLPGQDPAGRAALNYAVAAMRVYNDHFGEYPFTNMAVAAAPLEFRGMEYPQVSLIGVQSYTDYRGELEFLIAHEVAHQWWYQMVHNDPVSTPWLDEGLSEYSVYIYYESMQGRGAADDLQDQRWELPVNLLAEQEADAPVGLPVAEYATGSQYETIVYGKGALFFAQVRRVLGERQFEELLQGYLADNRWTIVTPNTLLDRIDLAAHPEIATLIDRWGIHPPAAAPQPAATPLP